MKALQIAAIQLICRDVEATAEFYQSTFGFRRCGGRSTALALGDQHIDLIEKAFRDIRAPANSTAFQHFAIVVSDMNEAMNQLRGLKGWSAMSRSGPEKLPPASGGVTAFKFRDPDGHPLELLQFPDEAIPRVWQEKRAGLFLGVDHSAITVSDTGKSITFYQTLGFSLLGRQINRGVEQERLDGLAGAVVEVARLAVADAPPPHLELLCYREPRADFVASTDSRPTTALLLNAAPKCPMSLSADVEKATQVRDPDGHILIFQAPSAPADQFEG